MKRVHQVKYIEDKFEVLWAITFVSMLVAMAVSLIWGVLANDHLSQRVLVAQHRAMPFGVKP